MTAASQTNTTPPPSSLVATIVPFAVWAASCGWWPTSVAVATTVPALRFSCNNSLDSSNGTATGPSGPARLRCPAAPRAGTVWRVAPGAASNSSTPSGLRTATAPIPVGPMTIPSGTLPMVTPTPAGGERGAAAIAGSAGGMTPGGVGAALEVSAGEGVRPPQAAMRRPTTSQHVSDEPATRRETRIGSIIPTHRRRTAIRPP
jgi:hypothetical protein